MGLHLFPAARRPATCAFVLLCVACAGESSTPAMTGGHAGGESGGSGHTAGGVGGAVGLTGGTSPGGAAGQRSLPTGGAPAGGMAGGSTGGQAGAPPMADKGSPLIVAVGNWGYRAMSRDGKDWWFCGNPQQGSDHTPDLLRDVTWGDGVFVAVGGDRMPGVMRSLDGVHWQEWETPPGCAAGCGDWKGGVAYGDGVWLAGGGNGSLMRSSDGALSWTRLRPSPPISAVRGISYSGGRFFAGTDNGFVLVSSDRGDTWIAHKLWTRSVGAPVVGGGNTLMVPMAQWNGSGFDRACFVTHDLGTTWESCAQLLKGDSGLYVAHGGGQWVVRHPAGGQFTSPDARTWTEHTIKDFPSEFRHDGTRWIGLANKRVSTSTDLMNWTVLSMPDLSFRAWTIGTVLDKNLPVMGVPACQDKR